MMLLNPYRFGGAAPPFDPMPLYAGGVGGSLLDIRDASTLWSDDAGTVPAVVGGTVALITDLTGNGVHAYQPNASLRPYLRQDAGGTLYLEGDGTRWMYLGTTAAQTDLADVVVVAAARSSAFNRVLVDKPHASTHSDPYYRWSVWHSQIFGANECRVNGAPRTSLAGSWSLNADTVLTVDVPGGTIRADGLSGAPFTPEILAYPNSVQARIFSNASSGEVFVGRLYALSLVGKPLTLGELSGLESWVVERMP